MMTRKTSRAAATPPRFEDGREYRVVLCALAYIGSEPQPVGRTIIVSGSALNTFDPASIRSAEPI